MKSGSWKKAETRFARDVGTERKPCDGSRDGKDFEAGMFGYQLKFRNRFPSMWWEWLAGIVAKCAETNQIGVLVLNRPHHDRKEALVVLRWEDWVALHGEPQIETGSVSSLGQAVELGAKRKDHSSKLEIL